MASNPPLVRSIVSDAYYCVEKASVHWLLSDCYHKQQPGPYCVGGVDFACSTVYHLSA
jgi:hypothetical protein